MEEPARDEAITRHCLAYIFSLSPLSLLVLNIMYVLIIAKADLDGGITSSLPLQETYNSWVGQLSIVGVS